MPLANANHFIPAGVDSFLTRLEAADAGAIARALHGRAPANDVPERSRQRGDMTINWREARPSANDTGTMWHSRRNRKRYPPGATHYITRKSWPTYSTMSGAVSVKWHAPPALKLLRLNSENQPRR